MQVRLFIMMALQLGIWGAWAPKLFPYMASLGFSPSQQALVGSCWGISGLIAIFFSNQFADRRFAAERFLSVSHAISALCLLGVAWSTSFSAFFGFYLLYSIVYVPTISVTNAIAFANLQNPVADFGKVRMGGTVGWVLASWPFVFILSADAQPGEVRSIFIVAAVVSIALAAYALTLPNTPPRKDAREPFAWRKTFGLLRRPVFAVLFFVTFIDSVIHQGYYVLADPFLTDRVGIAGNLSMVVLSIGQVAEIVAMLVLGYFLARLGWKVTMVVGVLGHAARFLVFSYFADSVPAIIAVQLLHGICYAFFFAALYIFVDHYCDKDIRTSAQGLFNLLILGVGNVVASIIFPQLAAYYSVDGVVDYQALFLVPAGMSLFAAAVLVMFFRPEALAARKDTTKIENEQATEA